MSAHDYYRELGHRQVWLWSPEGTEGQVQLETVAKALYAAHNLGGHYELHAETYRTMARAALEALSAPRKAVTEVPEALFILAPNLRHARGWARIHGYRDPRSWVHLRHWSQLAGTYRGEYVELPGDYDRDELRETLHVHGFTKKEI
jgi:hypothetical protein